MRPGPLFLSLQLTRTQPKEDSPSARSKPLAVKRVVTPLQIELCVHAHHLQHTQAACSFAPSLDTRHSIRRGTVMLEVGQEVVMRVMQVERNTGEPTKTAAKHYLGRETGPSPSMWQGPSEQVHRRSSPAPSGNVCPEGTGVDDRPIIRSRGHRITALIRSLAYAARFTSQHLAARST